MDSRYYEFVTKARDVKRAQHTQKVWDREVTGKGRTQDLCLISGSQPQNQKQIKQKFAPPTDFAGEPKLGTRQVFSDRFEKPPDGLFKTSSAQSLKPWKVDNEVPIMTHVPPLRVSGQKLFPVGKAETEAAWRKLMGTGGARTAIRSVEPTGEPVKIPSTPTSGLSKGTTPKTPPAKSTASKSSDSAPTKIKVVPKKKVDAEKIIVKAKETLSKDSEGKQEEKTLKDVLQDKDFRKQFTAQELKEIDKVLKDVGVREAKGKADEILKSRAVLSPVKTRSKLKSNKVAPE